MARNHARIDLAIWDDLDFVALSPEAQRLYLFLISQRDLTYAGLLPMRLRRWAGRSATTTVEQIAAALAELDATRFVVCDHDAEEVLVRSLIRRDGIYKQPNTLAAALDKASEITSPVLRRVLADELRRLPAEITGPAPAMAAAALLAGLSAMPHAVEAALAERRAPKTKPSGRRPARHTPVAAPNSNTGVERPTARGAKPAARDESVVLGEPDQGTSSNPSGNPSAMAQGEGSRGQGCASPVTLSSTHRGGSRASASAHPPARETNSPSRDIAARLVAEHVGKQPRRVADALAGEVRGLLTEGVAAGEVSAGLRRWASKSLPAWMLPELVGEAMRTDAGQRMSPEALRGKGILPGRDAKVAAWLALRDEVTSAPTEPVAAEEGRDVGRLARETAAQIGALVGAAA